MTRVQEETKTIATSRAKRAPSATTGVDGMAAGPRRVELPVSGLTCTNCVQAVERVLRAVHGVKKVTVNLAEGRAFVEYDPNVTTVSDLHDAIKATGYRSETARSRFKIEGITCASCVTKIEATLKDTPGVLSASVNVGTEEAVVEYVPSVADLAAIKAAVASAGYKIVTSPAPSGPSAADKEAEEREREYRSLMRKWWFGAGVGSFTMIMSYPWLFPVLRDWFPRESHSLWYMWAGMGVASL
ncbi:MAG: heavy metal translocating P-type ATPase, partial [Deltaproteobacteria bacterium]|nr:heavy metal translocating P-type ATPase [Deltaproteobacteria bacterium]